MRVAINQMAERHGYGQGTTGSKNGSCWDAAVATMTWEHSDCLLMTPADCIFNLVIDKGTLYCVMFSSDQIERRMNTYRDKIGRVLSLGNLEDEDGDSYNNKGGGRRVVQR